MVAPDGVVHVEEGDKPYRHSKFFNLVTTDPNTEDIELPDGSFIHTKNTVEGSYILILREIPD